MAIRIISKTPTENAVDNTGRFIFELEVNGVIRKIDVKFVGGNPVGLNKLGKDFDYKTYLELIAALKNEKETI